MRGQKNADGRKVVRTLAIFLALILAGCATRPPLPATTAERKGSQKTPVPSQYLQLFNGYDLAGWRRPLGEWIVVGRVEQNPAAPENLLLGEGPGKVVNGLNGQTSNLISVAEHGDVELHLEFIVPQGSNSGVYLQGRYEVQIFDSWQQYRPTYADCGGIYQRYENGRSFGGKAPRVNASLPPGSWQRFDIVFRAPRFDSSGRKIENARFVQVVHNGVIIHENVDVTGPTRSAAFADERPTGPLMLQGDHGPVAFQNMLLKYVNIP